MTTLREAAQQALEALENSHPKPYNEDVRAHYEAITALRAALEQPEQEPVAWIDNSEHPKHRLYRQSVTEKRLYGPLRPLYAHPPRREWQGLTDEETKHLWDTHGYKSAMCKPLVSAIEAALKEKNT
jgi:hypothetical protein